MTVARASFAQKALGRAVLRRTTIRTRSQSWRQIGRRNYASGHGESKSSELPWIIGSVGLTVPAAVWLYGQGPTKSEHHHEASHEESEESADAKDEAEPAEPAEDSEESKESKDDSKDDSKVEKDDDKEEKEEKDDSDDKADSDDSKDESSDDSSDKDSGDDAKAKKDKKEEKEDAGSDSPNAPGQINYKPESGKGPGEGQKGPRKLTEKKGEKDAQSSHSGAQNPYLDDDEKSKKGEGLKDTMKIHGTVDSNRPLR